MCRLDFPLLRIEVVGTVADVLGKSERVTEEANLHDAAGVSAGNTSASCLRYAIA